MNNIEILLVPILIVGYGAICYICGKGDYKKKFKNRFFRNKKF